MGCCTSAENMNVEEKIAEQMDNHETMDNAQDEEEPVEIEKEVEREASVPKQAEIEIVIEEITENESAEKEEEKPQQQERMNTMIQLPEPTLNEESDISSINTSPTTKNEEDPKISPDINVETSTPTPSPAPLKPDIEPTTPYTPIDQIADRLDLNVDENRLQFQIRMEVQETEEKFEREKQKHCMNISTIYNCIHVPP